MDFVKLTTDRALIHYEDQCVLCLVKTACHCAGKYITASGLEDSLIECDIFGTKTIQQVLHGTDYRRSLKGLMKLDESIGRLRWEAFIIRNEVKFEDQIEKIKSFQELLVRQDGSIKDKFEELVAETAELREEYRVFIRETSDLSEPCKYLNTFSSILDKIKNLVIADRDGDFNLHIKTVGELLPIFLQSDAYRYLRDASFYHELLKDIERSHPSLHTYFINGGFGIKTKHGMFNAVGADMKLEQSINRAAKSSHGIIGQMDNLRYGH